MYSCICKSLIYWWFMWECITSVFVGRIVTDLFLHIYLSSLKWPSVKTLCFQPCLVSDKLEAFILNRFTTTEPRRTWFFLVRSSQSTTNIYTLGKRSELWVCTISLSLYKCVHACVLFMCVCVGAFRGAFCSINPIFPQKKNCNNILSFY